LYWNAAEEALEGNSVTLILQYHVGNFNKASLLARDNYYIINLKIFLMHLRD